jgi:predicted homoserine dehydrogenase-like protein
MGFTPIVFGNRKGYYHANPPRDQMEFWASKQKLSLDQVTAATDGTKMQIEQALVANGFGATIACDGMLGPARETLAEGGLELAQHAARIGTPVADYVLAPRAPAGIFIVATHDPRQADALEYLKLGPGPYYVLVQNYHLCHLEIAKTIRRAAEGRSPLLNNSANPTISVAAIAKRALRPGERVARAIGSFELRGVAVCMSDHPGHVPIGLIANAVITKPIEPNRPLTFDDVELPDSLALRAWRQIASAGAHSSTTAPKVSKRPAAMHRAHQHPAAASNRIARGA